MGTVTTADGRSLYYETRGDAGLVLLLLNGMSQSTAAWMSQARHLSAHFRVLMYDARGQGRSDLGTGPVDLAGHLDDIDTLLDALSIPSAVLSGFSHGARVALGYAATRPERVDRLVLTSMGDADDALRRTIVRSWIEVLDHGGLEAMAWTTIPAILGRPFLEANEEHLEAMVRATLQRNTTEGLRALLLAMSAFPPPEPEARRVECPTLLVTSPDDQLVSAESARRLAAEIPDCTHVVIDASGHTIPIERPDEWRRVVLGFLGVAQTPRRNVP